jgi:aminoglycoside phosphotransferase family enzyme/predicted kinase
MHEFGEAGQAERRVRDLASSGLGLEETHISWVLLGKDSVWKVKKPVRFPYLDYGSLEKRRRACEAEVSLNRRLSPEAYLGVVPIVRDPSGRHRILAGTEAARSREAGEAVEWAVHMVRLPEADRGDVRLEAGTLSPRHLEDLAERLAAMHAAGAPGPEDSRPGDAEAVARNVEGNFEETRGELPALLGPERAAALEAGMLAFLRDREALFAERVRGGRIRDGHGDLRLGQVYFDGAGRSTVLDCLEFSDSLRIGDVAADAGFLSMDLRLRGREDLAERFLAAYARASDDYDLYALVDFYEAYRACVRGKIALGRDREAALRYFLLAERALGRTANPGRKAPLLAVGGGIATGKSTLSAALGAHLHAPVLQSDRIRKRLAGLDPLEPRQEGLWHGIYGEDETARLYAELFRRAGVILASGRPALIDASFRTRRLRRLARELARESGHPFLFLECRADVEVCRARLRERARSASVSDGREEMFEGFLASWEPLDDSERESALELDTTRPWAENLEKIGVALARLSG